MRSLSILMIAVLGLSLATRAHGATINLSEYVSDGGSPPLAEWLSASMDFALSSYDLDEGPVSLTLEADNRTDENPIEIPEYRINQLYFNMPDNVTAVPLTEIDGGPTTGWNVDFDQHVDGWGEFDVGLLDGVGEDEHQIFPGEMKTFTLELTGTGVIEGPGGIPGEYFFTTELSETAGDLLAMPMIVAAKFVDGDDSSAFGATDSPVIPEPTTLALLAIGGLVAARRRR